MSENNQRQREIDQAQAYLKSLENQVGDPLVNLNKQQDFSVHIEIDNSLGPARFKAHPTIEGFWYASQETFRAMKKDIFSLGEDIDEMTNIIECKSCKTNVDTQFWHHCPYCTAQFESK